MLSSGLKCTLITAAKRTTLGATLKLGNTVVGQTKAKKRRRGKTTLTIPLTAAGKTLLRGSKHRDPEADGHGKEPQHNPREAARKAHLKSLVRRKWGEQDSNLRRQSHRLYSATPLAARTSPRAVRRRL